MVIYTNIVSNIFTAVTESMVLWFWSVLKRKLRYKRIGYNLNVKRLSACLGINPITVDGFAAHFICTPVDWASDRQCVCLCVSVSVCPSTLSNMNISATSVPIAIKF